MKWIRFLEENAQRLQDKIAVIEQGSGKRLNYKELNLCSNKWANFLWGFGGLAGHRMTIIPSKKPTTKKVTSHHAISISKSMQIEFDFHLLLSTFSAVTIRPANENRFHFHK